jgi:hypothetical protein
MITYFSWWYGQGLINFWQAVIVMTGKVYSFFSIRTLIRTLFDPWKRDAISLENASLQARAKIWLDNFISRAIGFVIRLFTVILGLTTIAVFFLFFLSLILIWLLLPIVVVGLIINGIRVMING